MVKALRGLPVLSSVSIVARPKMGLIGRELLRRILLATLMVYIFTAGFVVWTQVLSQTMPIIDAEAGPLIVVILVMATLPGVSVIVLPLAFEIALMHVLLAVQSNGEAVALINGRATPLRIMLPGTVAALIVATVTAVTSLWIEPFSNLKAMQIIAQLEFSLLKFKSDGSSLKQISGGLFFQHGQVSSDGTINNIFLLDRRAASVESLYVAQSGIFIEMESTVRLQLTNGTIYVRSTTGENDHDFAFRHFLIAPSFLMGVGEAPKGARLTTTQALLQVLIDGGTNTTTLSEARVEMARRFSDWLYPLTFAAIVTWIFFRGSIAFGAREQQTPMALLLGTSLAAITKLAGMVILVNASASSTWAITAALLPLGVMVIFLLATTYVLMPIKLSKRASL